MKKDSASGSPEGNPRALGLQFMEQTHDVVGGQLDEHCRRLRVLLVAQLRFERLHGRNQPRFLCSQFLFRDLPVRQRAREGLELLHALLERRVLRLLVKPIRSSHAELSFRPPKVPGTCLAPALTANCQLPTYSEATSCFNAVKRACNFPRPPSASVFSRICAGRNCRSVHSRMAAVSCSSRSSPCVDGMNCATTCSSDARVM